MGFRCRKHRSRRRTLCTDCMPFRASFPQGTDSHKLRRNGTLSRLCRHSLCTRKGFQRKKHMVRYKVHKLLPCRRTPTGNHRHTPRSIKLVKLHLGDNRYTYQECLHSPRSCSHTEDKCHFRHHRSPVHTFANKGLFHHFLLVGRSRSQDCTLSICPHRPRCQRQHKLRKKRRTTGRRLVGTRLMSIHRGSCPCRCFFCCV